jgi:hypothetical protein
MDQNYLKQLIQDYLSTVGSSNLRPDAFSFG